MTPQRVFPPNTLLSAFCLVAATTIALFAFAAPASAQDDPATATIGGAECTGTNVEVNVASTSGAAILTENATPEADGTWQSTLSIPALDEPVIASATCFDGDIAIVEYSPISLRVQPGVAVGGVIELPARAIEGAVPATPTDEPSQPDELPETGPFTVPATGIALAMIAAGTGMAFVARQDKSQPLAGADKTSNWPSSHWDN